MDKVEKQGYESFKIDSDFVNVLVEDESIILANSSVIAVDKDGVDASSEVLDVSTLAVFGSKLVVRVRAGDEAHSPYKITFYAQTDLLNKWEIDVRLRIRER